MVFCGHLPSVVTFPGSHPYGHRWQPAGCSSERRPRTCRDRAIAHKNLSADSTPGGGEKHGGQNAEHARLPSVCGRGAPRGVPILIYPWGTRDCYVQGECSPISPNRLGPCSPRSHSTSGLCVFVKVSGNGGEGGIRTHGGSRLAGFQDRCFQPLSHLSNSGQSLQKIRRMGKGLKGRAHHDPAKS